MTHQDVTKTVSVEVRYFLDGNNAQNTYHVKYAGVIGITDLDALNTVFQNWLNAHWKPIAAADWEALQLVLTDLDSLAGNRKAYPIGPPIAGSIVSPAVPASVTLAVKAGVGHRGKGQNGRTYWIGLAESQVDANDVLTATGDAIVIALNELNTAIVAAPPFQGLCIPHRVIAGVKQYPALSELIELYLLSDYSLDVQKDRLPFHKKRRKRRTTP